MISCQRRSYRRSCQQSLSLSRLLFLCYAAVSCVEAGWKRPVLSIGIHSDESSFSSSPSSLDHALLEMLEPTIQWSADGNVAGMNVEAGVIVTVQDRTDLDIPYTFWAKLKKQLNKQFQVVGGMSFDAEYGKPRTNPVVSWDLSAQKSNGPSTVSLQLLGESNKKNALKINAIKASFQKIKLLGGGIWSVMPRYHLASKTTNVIVSYTMPEMATTITVDGNLKKQKITVTQKVGGDTIVAPSLTTDGNVEFVYSRSIPSLLGRRRETAATATAVFTTAIQSKASAIDVEYQDGPWIANVRAPFLHDEQGLLTTPSNIKFNIRRVVEI